MRRVFLLLLCIFVITFCSLTVSAHPGKTDYKGGHTDHSTGEYHYHHGYSAHNHYDMDGDGDTDCPYDFKDKTRHSGVDTSVRSPSTQIYSNYSYTVQSENSVLDKEEVEEVPAWVYWAFGGLSLLIIILTISNSAKKDTIAEIERRHKYEIDETVKSCDKKIAERQASDAEIEKIKSAISEAKATELKLIRDISSEKKELSNIRRMRCFAMEAPLDISFSDDGMPVYWKSRLDKPYGDYTVFVSLNSGVYHTDSFCGGYRTRKDHIFNVLGRARPCKRCAVGFFDFETVPDWYTQKGDVSNNNSLKINFR